jgi:hypothetical protein
MSNDISPVTPAATAPTISEVEDGKKKTQVNHEEFGNETEMDDLRKPSDEQRIDVTPEDVCFLCFSTSHVADIHRIDDLGVKSTKGSYSFYVGSTFSKF